MQSNLLKTFKSLSGYKWDYWTLWTDFIEMMAISISNAVDLRHKDAREERFEDIAKKYTSEEMNIFKQMYADLIVDLEMDPRDVLGEIFMELGLGDKWKGQFFTPHGLSRVMTRITLSKDKIQKSISDKGFVSISEDACGGGATLIASFNHIRQLGFNPQEILLIDASDIDRKACYMTYIQLSLLGANAVIRERDGLAPRTKEDTSTWYTPFYILNGWKFKSILDDVVKDKRLVNDGNGQISFI
jgi:putative type I restriction-modification system methyltransferase subunit|nr:MAG TPA: type I restriction-modification system methyltransferase [Caudoviricetes sp.]